MLQRRVLDTQVEQLKRRAPAPWGVWPWLGPVLTLAALIVVLQLVVHQVHLHGSAIAIADAVVGIVGDAALLVALVSFGRAAAASGGGWQRTYGLSEPNSTDCRPWLTGVAVVFVVRIVVGGIANGLTHGKATSEASNLRLHDITHLGVGLLVISTVIVAPVVEELMFRGLLLRTFMRRLQFWPAAWLSSIIFAAFHTYEVTTVVGAVTLAASIVVLGLTNCLLTRITGRLAPGMLVHATFNLLAILVVTHTSH